MTVSNAAYLKQFYDAAAAQGAKAVSSDFTPGHSAMADPGT